MTRCPLWGHKLLAFFDARELYGPAPSLGFVRDQSREVGRRAWKCGAAQVGHPRVDRGVTEGNIDLGIEPFDHSCRRTLWGAEPVPRGCFVAGYGLADRWNV